MSIFKFQQIKKTYRLTKGESDFLKKIPANYSKSWSGDLKDLIQQGILPSNAARTRDSIKERIKKKLLRIQGNYCIYCGMHFQLVGGAQREHIAYKHKYPQFTFTKLNIALACGPCNGFEKKSTKDLVDIYDSDYKRCTFTIVHPYFDDIESHIGLTFNGSDILLSEINGSIKGRNTIDVFKLMDYAQAGVRGGAYLRHKQQAKLAKKQIKQSNAISVRKYTF